MGHTFPVFAVEVGAMFRKFLSSKPVLVVAVCWLLLSAAAVIVPPWENKYSHQEPVWSFLLTAPDGSEYIVAHVLAFELLALLLLFLPVVLILWLRRGQGPSSPNSP
jgi:hypothetical protein